MSGWFSVTAHISAVCACTVSFALTLAPRSSSRVAASALPVRAAVISAVSPPGVAVFGSAPASSSARIIAALPLVAARPIGVTPYRFAAFTSAPALISASAVVRSSRRTAQCNAVVPSGCGASMALRSRGNARSTSLSPLMTASATGASALAANPAHRPSTKPAAGDQTDAGHCGASALPPCRHGRSRASGPRDGRRHLRPCDIQGPNRNSSLTGPAHVRDPTDSMPVTLWWPPCPHPGQPPRSAPGSQFPVHHRRDGNFADPTSICPCGRRCKRRGVLLESYLRFSDQLAASRDLFRAGREPS